MREHEQEEELNSEEYDEVHIFNSFNYHKKNQNCYVIIIENSLSETWKGILKNKYVLQQEDKVASRTILHTHSEPKITITHYHIPKADGQSKLHIQSNSQVANTEYIFGELPGLYALVRAGGVAAGPGVAAAASPQGDAASAGVASAGASSDGPSPRRLRDRQTLRPPKQDSKTQTKDTQKKAQKLQRSNIHNSNRDINGISGLNESLERLSIVEETVSNESADSTVTPVSTPPVQSGVNVDTPVAEHTIDTGGGVVTLDEEPEETVVGHRD